MEDAADTFAALRLIRVGSDFSRRVLTDAAEGWFMADWRDRKMQDEVTYYDEHGLNQQRPYQIVCLMVGYDDQKFKDLALLFHGVAILMTLSAITPSPTQRFIRAEPCLMSFDGSEVRIAGTPIVDFVVGHNLIFGLLLFHHLAEFVWLAGFSVADDFRRGLEQVENLAFGARVAAQDARSGIKTAARL
jgi:hypothetical protein